MIPKESTRHTLQRKAISGIKGKVYKPEATCKKSKLWQDLEVIRWSLKSL